MAGRRVLGPDSGAKKFGLENGFRNGFNLRLTKAVF